MIKQPGDNIGLGIKAEAYTLLTHLAHPDHDSLLCVRYRIAQAQPRAVRADPNPQQYANNHRHCYHHAHALPDTHRHGNPNDYADANRNSDAYAYPDAYAHAKPHLHRDTDGNFAYIGNAASRRNALRTINERYST